jgi:hypothetical protein
MASVLALICAFGLLVIAMYRFTLTIDTICDNMQTDALVEHIRKNQHVGTFEIQMIDSPHSDLMP